MKDYFRVEKNKYLLAASGSCLNPNSSAQLLMCSSIGAPSFSLITKKKNFNRNNNVIKGY